MLKGLKKHLKDSLTFDKGRALFYHAPKFASASAGLYWASTWFRDGFYDYDAQEKAALLKMELSPEEREGFSKIRPENPPTEEGMKLVKYRLYRNSKGEAFIEKTHKFFENDK